MERRKFLSTLIGGVAAAAAVRTFPFRVYSFPKEVISPTVYQTEIFFMNSKTGILSTPHLRRGCALTPVMLEEQMRRIRQIYPYDCTV